MASHDFKRMNPGIQVSLLNPGIASPTNPRLVVQDSSFMFAMQSVQTPVGGANPHSGYALNSSGSLNLLTKP